MKKLWLQLILLIAIVLSGCSIIKLSPHLKPSTDIGIRNVAIYDVENSQILAGMEILIDGKNIKSVHPQPNPPTTVTTVIDGSQMLALPGFVNTHTHLWQHIARSFEPAATLQKWIRIYRYAHYLTLEELRLVTFIAAKEAQLSGITTVADFASVNFQSSATETTMLALKQAKMGGHVVWWHPAAFLPSSLRAKNIARLRKAATPLDVVMGFGPLSFFDLPAVYDGIFVAMEQSMALSEHTMENPEESRAYQKRVKEYLDRFGKQLQPADLVILKSVGDVPPLSSMDGVVKLRRFARQMLAHDGIGGTLSPADKALLNPLKQDLPTMIPLLDHLGVLPGFLAIHSVWLNPSDFKAYVARGTTVSHNPESNMYLSSGAAPIVDYQTAGITISLGTDGAASNDRIDFFTAMRNMINLQKVYNMNVELTAEIKPWDILKAATINGAEAMGIANRTGSIKTGKEADIVLLSKKFIDLAPYVDKNKIAIIINSAAVRDVKTVISDGNIVVSNGRLAEHNEAELAQRLDRIVKNVIIRCEKGKNWKEIYPISSLQQYASVREPDNLALEIVNDGKYNKNLLIAFSGNPFGGTAVQMLSQTTLRRFPYESNPDYAEYSFTLANGQAVTVRKAPGSYHYIITGPDGLQRIRKGKAEQILLLDTDLLSQN